MNDTKAVTYSTNWRLFFGFWALISIVYVVRAIFMSEAIPLIGDTDDAMRLVVVNDWLAGQGWFDHIQYRLNTPFGASIHWSRLVDVPIGALILILQPLSGANAPFIAAWIWPLLLLGMLLYLSAGLAVRMAGPEALLPGLVLPVLSAAVLVEFAPGRVDHHSIQIVLTLAMAYASVLAWHNPRWAIGAGLAAATSLAIGMETLPQIATTITVFGLFWVAAPEKGPTMRLFGIGFALFSLVHLVLALPPADWFQVACDALSIVHVGAAIGVGIVFVILPLLPRVVPLAHWWQRLLAGGALGLLMVAGLLMIFPDCRGGPYGQVDPWLVENWLSRVIEAKPAWNSFAALPAYTLGIVLPPLLALAAIGWIAATSRKTLLASDKRAEWLILGLFLLIGIAVMVIQVRGARLVAGMIAPAGAFVIIAVRQHYLKSKGIKDALVLMGTWLAFSGLAVAVIAGMLLPKGSDEISTIVAGGTNKNDCLQPQAFTALAAMPPTRIMTPIDLGAHMLLFTPHSVVGAPYHRNQKGLLDTFSFLNAPLEQARSIIEERGISLIVTCPAMAEMGGLKDTPDSAFVRLAASGDLPDWIKDVSDPNSPLKIYEIQN